MKGVFSICALALASAAVDASSNICALKYNVGANCNDAALMSIDCKESSTYTLDGEDFSCMQDEFGVTKVHQVSNVIYNNDCIRSNAFDASFFCSTSRPEAQAPEEDMEPEELRERREGPCGEGSGSGGSGCDDSGDYPTEAPSPSTISPTSAPTVTDADHCKFLGIESCNQPATILLCPNMCFTGPTAAPTTLEPTPAPTPAPTPTPSASPTTTTPTKDGETWAPTSAPTTSGPTSQPTPAPSPSPTPSPTPNPTPTPTPSPTTSTPSASPTTTTPTKDGETWAPTSTPTTSEPTSQPTSVPSTSSPTSSPTPNPTDAPSTSTPTETPTPSPSSSNPTANPTATPSTPPTPAPTSAPTRTPIVLTVTWDIAFDSLTDTTKGEIQTQTLDMCILRSNGQLELDDFDGVLIEQGSVVAKAILKQNDTYQPSTSTVQGTQNLIDNTRGTGTVGGVAVQTIIHADSTLSPTASPTRAPITVDSATGGGNGSNSTVIAIVVVIIIVVLVFIIVVVVLRRNRNKTKAPAKTTPQVDEFQMQSFNEEKANVYGDTTIVTTNPDEVAVAEPTVSPKGKGMVRVESFC
eukprot:m.51930 g.51930  ORF g.51930 m.51930 type:complete len:580 (+) comp21519_c0_seq2:303-2042(+)